MSFRATTLRRSLLTLLILASIGAPRAQGQLTDASGKIISPVIFSDREAIVTSFVPAPTLGGTFVNSGSNNQWLKVEFHYGITPAVGNYQDAVQFKVWIEGRDLLAKDAPVPGQGVAVGLTGSVTYVNIPAGRDLYGVFYVHPATLGRYSTERGVEDFDRKFDIHVAAYVGGVLMDKIDKNKGETDPAWFEKLRPIPGLVYRQDQCAFIVVDSDRYPGIKVPAESAGAGTSP